MLGGYQGTDVLQFWDIRKTGDGPFKIIDWCGGLKDKKGDWIGKMPENNEALMHQFNGLNGFNAAFLYSAKFNHTGEFVIAGGGTGQNNLRVFRYEDGEIVANIHDLVKSVFSIDVCKTKDTFVFGSADSHVRIVDIKKKKDA